jgi:hypothetical protein
MFASVLAASTVQPPITARPSSFLAGSDCKEHLPAPNMQCLSILCWLICAVPHQPCHSCSTGALEVPLMLRQAPAIPPFVPPRPNPYSLRNRARRAAHSTCSEGATSRISRVDRRYCLLPTLYPGLGISPGCMAWLQAPASRHTDLHAVAAMALWPVPGMSSPSQTTTRAAVR